MEVVELSAVRVPLEPGGKKKWLRPTLLFWKDAAGKVVGANGMQGNDALHASHYQVRNHLPKRAFIIGAHGVPGKFEQLPTGEALAALVRHTKDADHIFMQVCSAGVAGPDGESLALKVARATGKPVVAANGPIIGNAMLATDGRSRLVAVVSGDDIDGAPPVLPPDRGAWSKIHPNGTREVVKASRYFRDVAATGDSYSTVLDPRARLGRDGH